MGGIPFESGILPVLKHACEESYRLPCYVKRSAGVTPEVNLRECTSHMPPASMNEADHSSFESQTKHHQKSKTGISVIPEKN